MTNTETTKIINPIDRDALRDRVRASTPVPNFCIDGFLDEAFAERVLAAYPSFEEASKLGRSFSAVNEQKKIQITDSGLFAEPVAELHRALAAPEFTEMLSHVFDIPNLLADPQLDGGGMHQTGARGHLDVHIDFNFIEDRQLHRRLNILVYFNKDWRPEWGGEIELWDPEVKNRVHAYQPLFNRCVVFETNEVSYHGVTAVKCPPDRSRKSFAAYYYTKEAPAHYTGENHSTIFKARPDEVFKGSVLMPLEKAKRGVREAIARIKKSVRG
jgi:hypothetical protein